MTDKTLGAYARREKPSPSEFARAEFARSANRRAAVRMGWTDSPYAWKVVDMPDDEGWLSDDDLSDLGWSPVLQCPDPEQHATGRPPTPDAITDEMVGRMKDRMHERGMGFLSSYSIHELLIAALTEPPARPDGAGDIEATLFEWNEMDDNGDNALNPDIIAELADHLARSFPGGGES